MGGATRVAEPDSVEQTPGLLRRLFSRHAATLLARNTVVSCGIFAFDLALLWALVAQLGMGKLVAAAVAFVAANSIHYIFGRTWIFRGTDRHIASGYVYFLINAGIGLVITIALFAAFIAWTPINYLVARTLVSVVAGLTVFLLNAILNFRHQALNRLVGYLERNGHQVRVYSPVTDTPAFEPQGELVPVPSIRLPLRGEFRLALRIPSHIRDDIRRFAPDLVHVSTPDILGTRAQTLAKRMGVPVAASFHTRFESYLDFYGLGWLKPLAEAQLRHFYRRSDHVLAPTPGIVEEMELLRGDDRVSLWSRGVDRELFDPARRDSNWRGSHGWSDDDVVLLLFGRLVLEKGVEEFVSTVRLLRARGVKVRVLVVGDGPAKSAFDALGDAVFTGHLDGPELARAIASADILLHPSRTEAFGNVVLEAMASGLAVVCAAADSAAALVEQGRTGFLCPPGDIDSFAAVIGDLARDPEKRRAIDVAARAASARFSWDAASESVLRAYQSVLSR